MIKYETGTNRPGDGMQRVIQTEQAEAYQLPGSVPRLVRFDQVDGIRIIETDIFHHFIHAALGTIRSGALNSQTKSPVAPAERWNWQRHAPSAPFKSHQHSHHRHTHTRIS